GVIGHRLLVMALLEVYFATTAEREGVVGVESDGFGKIGKRLIPLLLACSCNAAQVVEGVILRCDRQRSRIVGNGSVELATGDVNGGAVAADNRILWPQLQGLGEVGESRGVALVRLCNAPVAVRLRIVWVLLQRLEGTRFRGTVIV